jgi:hypothetical protein
MRAALGMLALVIVLATLPAGTARANPALLAARAAQIASKAAQVARTAGRAMKLSRMTRMMQKARKGMGALKAPGSLGRMRAKMRKSMLNRTFDKMRNGAMDRHNSMRKLMSRRTMNPRHNVATFAKRQLQRRTFATQMKRITPRRLMEMHRSQQRRSSASQNSGAAEAQRARMRRSSESRRHGSSSRGMFATALAH